MQAILLPEGCEVRCRGCTHRGWEPDQSEGQKEAWLKSQLRSWSDVIEPIRGVRSSQRWNYRRKVSLHAEWKGNQWAFGLLSPIPGSKFEFEVIDIPRCPIHSDLIKGLIRNLSTKLPSPGRFPLVYLTVSGTLATLVLKSNQMPELPELDWAQMGLSSLYVNLNPSAGNRVYSSRGWRLIWGEGHAVESGMQYGPECFQQLIPSLHEHSLSEAISFLNPKKGSGVLDLCSGIGRSLHEWKKAGAHFLGVELGSDAVRCAEWNIGAGSCLRGKASDRLPQLEDWIQTVNPYELLLYANPPRLGLESQVTEWITHFARPVRMAYLSCSAGTLKRDLSVLTQSGYVVRRIIPYDFFPQTHHVETLTLLSQ